MFAKRSTLLRVLAFCTLTIATSGMSRVAAQVQDIEDLFPAENNTDISGEYPIAAVFDDSTTGTATIELSKWKTFTSQRGKTFQTYQLKGAYNEWKFTGVGAFDGHRLYTACREGDKKNYFVMVLTKLVLPQVISDQIFEFWRVSWADNKKGDIYEWKGDVPWYGHLDFKDDVFGYYFWSDGTWGSYSTYGGGWPLEGDSIHFHQREMKKDGKYEKNIVKAWWDAGRLSIEPNGENTRINVHKGYGGKDDYIGTGMMLRDDLTGRDFLVAMMGGPDAAFVGCLELVGKEFKGVTAMPVYTGRTTETWAIPEAVIQKNPGLFK